MFYFSKNFYIHFYSLLLEILSRKKHYYSHCTNCTVCIQIKICIVCYLPWTHKVIKAQLAQNKFSKLYQLVNECHEFRN